MRRAPRWLMSLLAVTCLLGAIGIILFFRAGTWQRSDPIASTLGFVLAFLSTILSIRALFTQQKQTQNELEPGHPKSRAKDAGDTSTTPAQSDPAGVLPAHNISRAPTTGGPPGRPPAFRWLIRLGSPTAAAGAGGCLVDIALGAVALVAVLAMSYLVGPIFNHPSAIDRRYHPSVVDSPSYPQVGATPDITNTAAKTLIGRWRGSGQISPDGNTSSSMIMSLAADGHYTWQLDVIEDSGRWEVHGNLVAFLQKDGQQYEWSYLLSPVGSPQVLKLVTEQGGIWELHREE